MAELVTQIFSSTASEHKIYLDELKDLHNDPVHAFYLYGGGVFYNLHQLIEALGTMHEDAWHHHVNPERNDFANWISGVYGLNRLGQRMKYFKNRLALKQFLKTYFEEGSAPAQAATQAPETAATPTTSTAASHATIQSAAQSNNPAATAASPQSPSPDAPIRLLTEDEASDILKKVKDLAAHPFQNLIPEEFSDSVDRQKDRANELRRRISDARKEGKDLFFCTLLVRRIDPQIKLAMVTAEQKDLDKLKSIIDDVEHAYEEESQTEPLNVKKEIEQMAREQIEQDAKDHALALAQAQAARQQKELEQQRAQQAQGPEQQGQAGPPQQAAQAPHPEEAKASA